MLAAVGLETECWEEGEDGEDTGFRKFIISSTEGEELGIGVDIVGEATLDRD